MLLVTTAHAEFKVADIQPRLSAGALVLNGNLDLALTQKTEEALSKGIELPLIFELRLARKRTLLWDQRLASWSVRRTLQYHALSGQYLVGAGASYDSFLSLTEALKFLGSLNELRLPLPETMTSPVLEDEYSAQLRVHLDIEALPAPLRPVAYTTPSWHLNSGWTSWNVAH